MALTDEDIQGILSGLTPEEQKQLFEKLGQSFNTDTNQSKSARRQVKGETDKVYCCIYCGSINYKGNGYTRKGVKRYRCKDCNRTWSENYGDSLRYTHLSEDTWREMLRGFVEELSIPKIANNIW